MTEQEAIERLKCMRAFMEIEDKKNDCKFLNDDYEANKIAIKALEDVQQYRAIGTPEECLEALDKQKAKKPCKENTIWYCPTCRGEIYWDTDYGQQKFTYCPDCGQKLNWESEEE